jgi:hypothetical protein
LRVGELRVFQSNPTRMVRSGAAFRSAVRYASGVSLWTGGPGIAALPIPPAEADC